jgi:hypothetical protein
MAVLQHCSGRLDPGRWHTVARVLAAGFVSLALLDGCGVAAPAIAPTPTESPATPPARVLPNASQSPSTATALPTLRSPTASPPATAAAGTTDPFLGRVVKTLAQEGLRVRSQPGTRDDSYPYRPLLPLGTQLLVLDGPVLASNHPWYEVVPLSPGALPSGWVASAEEDGEPWLAVDAFECPPVPTDLHSLAALPRGVGLACFPRVPIRVEARLLSCDCDADGPAYTPSWFFLGSGSPDLLVEPAVTSAKSVNPADWFVLNLDPAGEHPDVLPVGEVVTVEGIFDHPAASGCTRTDPPDAATIASQDCRLEFAVTRLLARTP